MAKSPGLYGVLSFLLLLAVETLGQGTFVPVREIEDQLLMAAGTDARSSIQVFDSADKFLEAGAAVDLLSPASGNTTVFGSVVVISNSNSDGSNSSSFSSESDANIDTAAFFQVEVLNSSESNTTLQARFALRDCDLQRNCSTNQIVFRNAFFGTEFAATNLHFRVQESDLEEELDSSSGATSRCVMAMLFVCATVTELYPECEVKFKSTDVQSLFPNWRRRRSNSSMGGPSTLSRDALTSSVDVYTKDALCDFECGVAAMSQTDKFTAGFPGIEKCYDCSSVAQGGLLLGGLPVHDRDRVLPNAILHGVGGTDRQLGGRDGLEPGQRRRDYAQPRLELDTIEFHYSVLNFVASGEASVTCKGSITVVVFAPNGCLLEDDTIDIDLPFKDILMTHWGIHGRFRERQNAHEWRDRAHTDQQPEARELGYQDADGTCVPGHGLAQLPRRADHNPRQRADKGVRQSRGVREHAHALPRPPRPEIQELPGDHGRLSYFMAYNVAGGFEDTKLIYGFAMLYRGYPDHFLNLPAIRYEKSYKSGCVARFVLAVQRSTIQALVNDDARKGRLLRALTTGLSFIDLNANGMRVVAISPDLGTVEIEMSVPPSITDEFATAELFTAETNARAKSDFFHTYVSAEVGLPVDSVCPQGFWGTACDQVCSTVGCGAHTNCLLPTCDSITGETHKCEACVPESWGSTCDIGCLPPDTCSNTTCAQDTGVTESCRACNTGEWGDLCLQSCSLPTCVVTTCDMATGTPLSCTSCVKGYSGRLCEDRDFVAGSGVTGHAARAVDQLRLAALAAFVLVIQTMLL